MKTGVVKNYIPSTRYGFITDDDGSGDIFVHLNQLKESSLGDKVDTTSPMGKAFFQMGYSQS